MCVLPELCVSSSTRVSGSSEMRLVCWLVVSFLAMMGDRGRSRSPCRSPMARSKAPSTRRRKPKRGDEGMEEETEKRPPALSPACPPNAALAAVLSDGHSAGSVVRLLAPASQPQPPPRPDLRACA
ncbi:hypothetical protein SORBI_3004G327150 [Sorghum bicolor]|uniref:Uncharacterized protein n=1 Tax=Sorghum bicolor TaxID=4558 RepID=A0A194YSU4_SORBI|nr:hypothetical protein SORBI_3004G327150 [Sorghum bicolor]